MLRHLITLAARDVASKHGSVPDFSPCAPTIPEGDFHIQVREHVDSWDTSRCSLPAKLAWNASRAAWSFAETSKDLGEDAGKVLGTGKGDEDSGRQVCAAPKPSALLTRTDT